MSDVQFDEGGGYAQNYSTIEEGEVKGLLGLVLKTGIVKTAQQANIVLGAVFVIISAITIYLLFISSFSSNSGPAPVDVKKINQSQFSKFR